MKLFKKLVSRFAGSEPAEKNTKKPKPVVKKTGAQAHRREPAPQKHQQAGTGFANLGLRAEILRAIKEEGYQNPTPIQAQSIPALVAGRDLLGCAQTGTGKTAAFALPVLQQLTQNKRRADGIRCLVLTPTRELALQVSESFQTYGKHLRVRSAVVFGGVSLEPQKRALKRGLEVLVATPGRLLDLSQQGFVDLVGLEILVLDEADRMLDMGFLPDVKRVIKMLPTKRQNVLFSATMPKDIAALSARILQNPVTVEVAPVSSTSDQVEQSLYYVRKAKKRDLLLQVLDDKTTVRVLVFTRTKATANRVAKFLVQRDITAEPIHGNKSQGARQRALDNFKKGKTRVLVASDLAARGLDVDVISHVINYDLPNVAETYVHRIGRTGRAAAVGKAISFSDAEEQAYVGDIEKVIRKKIPVVEGHPYELTERELAEGKASGPPKMGGGNRRRRPSGGGSKSGAKGKPRRQSPGNRQGQGNAKSNPKKTQKKAGKRPSQKRGNRRGSR